MQKTISIRQVQECSAQPRVDVSKCVSRHSWRNKSGRALWAIVWRLLFLPTPKVLHGWRRFLLRMFGATIGPGVHVHPSVRIWAPWNLEMGEHSCLAPRVDCYCVERICIGEHATVSQYTFLCTASHDYRQPHLPLVTAPITIGAGVWVCADVFVGPGVQIGDGAVVAARSTVVRDVTPWTVNAGNPARMLKARLLKHEAV